MYSLTPACRRVQVGAMKLDETRVRLTDAERAERAAQLQRTMSLLVHASACRSDNCPSSNCSKVKALFSHAVACAQKVTGGCPLCRWVGAGLSVTGG